MWRHQGPETKAMLLDSTTNGHRASISFEESCNWVSTTIIFLLLLVITSLSLSWFIKRKRNLQTDNPTPSALETFHGKISYREIRTATDDFSLNNLIGSGSFGTVFKALLPTMDKVVAVKVLNMERRGAKKRIQSSHLRVHKAS
ncbi:hypothetical protein Bca4012_051055 [Brassica carinata]|uniref:Protein kinase domain-containing protein n=1 Tax=Brassica carinata TaxID=52824 RepID=A0A8X7UJW3_BRACI|nr:hypothetical protein Bca52824_053730 [Brassica carinata]